MNKLNTSRLSGVEKYHVYDLMRFLHEVHDCGMSVLQVETFATIWKDIRIFNVAMTCLQIRSEIPIYNLTFGRSSLIV